MVKITCRTLGLQERGTRDQNKGYKPLEDTACQAMTVRCHGIGPISLAHARLPVDRPEGAGFICLNETRPSPGIPALLNRR